jgi:hypothetical protein
MLYYPDGTIQYAGVVLGLGGVAGHACVCEPRGSKGYCGRACLEQDVSCVTAACIAIRARVFRTLGGFDDKMPLAYNDVALCLRLRSAGWRIIWTPAAELVHRESASLGRHNEGPRADQFKRDVALMRQRWGSLLQADPFYNRNLSLKEVYRLSFPPRPRQIGSELPKECTKYRLAASGPRSQCRRRGQGWLPKQGLAYRYPVITSDSFLPAHCEHSRHCLSN